MPCWRYRSYKGHLLISSNVVWLKSFFVILR